MKFLCLHGMGTNSSILEAQFGPICAHFEAQGHEFVFVDGLVECKGADGKFISVSDHFVVAADNVPH